MAGYPEILRSGILGLCEQLLKNFQRTSPMCHHFGIFDLGLDRDDFDRQCADVDANVGHGDTVPRKPGERASRTGENCESDRFHNAWSCASKKRETTVRSENRRTTALMMLGMG